MGCFNGGGFYAWFSTLDVRRVSISRSFRIVTKIGEVKKGALFLVVFCSIVRWHFCRSLYRASGISVADFGSRPRESTFRFSVIFYFFVGSRISVSYFGDFLWIA